MGWRQTHLGFKLCLVCYFLYDLDIYQHITNIPLSLSFLTDKWELKYKRYRVGGKFNKMMHLKCLEHQA